MSLFLHAARSLQRRPGYTVGAVTCVALGVGLTTALVAALQGIVRRPLPFPDESRLVVAGKIAYQRASDGTNPNWLTFMPDLVAWEKSTTLERSAVVWNDIAVVKGRQPAEHVEGATASHGLLQTLGVAPMLGRWFDAQESRSPVVVIGERLWRRQFGGDSAVIGQALHIQGSPWTVIGVMPAATGFPFNAEFWRPHDGMMGQLIGRMKPSVSPDQVSLELETLSPSVPGLRRAGYTVRGVVLPLREQLFGRAAPPLRLMIGAAALLLLVACVNVTNLSVARTLDRAGELAVRSAMGASGRSLALLILVEHVGLSMLGFIGAAAVALWATGVIARLTPASLMSGREVHLDGMAVAVCAALALAATLLAAAASLLVLGRSPSRLALAVAGRQTTSSPGAFRLRRALMAAQLALAVVLVTAAALMTQSVIQLIQPAHLGFTPSGVLVARVDLLAKQYTNGADRQSFAQRVIERVAGLPLVQSVGVGPQPLVAGDGETLREGYSSLTSVRDPAHPDAPPRTIWVKHVDTGYVASLRVRVRGRSFTAADDGSAPQVVMLTKKAATLFFGNRDPVGQLLTLEPVARHGPPRLVVGVIDDLLQRDVAIDATPEMLFPIAQQAMYPYSLVIAVRTSGNPDALIGPVREVIRSVDPEIAPSRLESMDRVVAASLKRHTLMLSLLGALSVVGWILAVIGVYAVVSYTVAARTREMGVRLALGAQRGQIVRMVLAENGLTTAAGLAIGLGVALVLSRYLSAFLVGISSRDGLTLVLTPILLGLAATAAAYIPAHRAARLDPTAALRSE